MAKKKNTFKIPTKFLFALSSLVFIISVLTVLNLLPKNPEMLSQFNSKTSILWSENNYFGEEDRAKFPAIIKPEYVNTSDSIDFLIDEDGVYTFELNGKRYVYPEKILAFHHIVNDTIDGVPVAVSLCLLTDSAAVYERKFNGLVHKFGTLAILYNGNLVMYDNITDTYWLQLTGEAIKGNLKGTRLKNFVRIDYARWGNIKSMPNLKILPPQKEMSFYDNFYIMSMKSKLGLFAIGKKKVPDTYPEYTQGLGLRVGDEAKFYKLETIHKAKLIEDTVGNWNLLILGDDVTGAAKIFRRFVDGDVLTFKKVGQYLVDNQTHSKWNLDGVATDGKLKGKRLVSPFYTKVYWFAWWALYPDTKY